MGERHFDVTVSTERCLIQKPVRGPRRSPHYGLGHHSSFAIEEIGITVFQLSGTDRRNNAVALIR
jgi:hypothetical protein